jgi:hypothetical protein
MFLLKVSACAESFRGFSCVDNLGGSRTGSEDSKFMSSWSGRSTHRLIQVTPNSLLQPEKRQLRIRISPGTASVSLKFCSRPRLVTDWPNDSGGDLGTQDPGGSIAELVRGPASYPHCQTHYNCVNGWASCKVKVSVTGKTEASRRYPVDEVDSLGSICHEFKPKHGQRSSTSRRLDSSLYSQW